MTTLQKSTFKALSECASSEPHKLIINTVFFNDDGFCVTNGHVAAVYQTDKTKYFTTVDRDSGNVAYSYNHKLEQYSLTESRKLGRYQSTYDLGRRIPKKFDLNTTLLPSEYPNLSQLIPDQDNYKDLITVDENQIAVISMFANQQNISVVSLFVDFDRQELIYVPSIAVNKSTTLKCPLRLKVNDKTYSIKEKRTGHSIQYITSFDPRYMVDIWNLCDEIPGSTKMHLEITDDRRPIRFDSSSDNKSSHHTYGVIMPIQIKDVAELKIKANLK